MVGLEVQQVLPGEGVALEVEKEVALLWVKTVSDNDLTLVVN